MDPLGLVPLWSRLGRKVVGNLTTVTNSVRGFSTVLLGCYFASELVEDEAEQGVLGRFLVFEQLAAYARHVINGESEGIRGIDRVRKRAAGGNAVRVGVAREHQILSNQKTYGLWGLFTVASRSSGLLQEQRWGLTSTAREFVERVYVRRMRSASARAVDEVLHVLGRPSTEVPFNSSVLRSVAEALQPRIRAEERQYLTDHLVMGGPSDRTGGLQTRLAATMEHHLKGSKFGVAELSAVIRAAERQGDGELAAALGHIRDMEALIVPMNAAFGQAQRCHGKTVRDVADDLRSTWAKGGIDIRPEVLVGVAADVREAFGRNADAQQRLGTVAGALRRGSYDEALRALIAHNGAVMQGRSGAAAWIRIDENDRLDVRFREDTGRLIDGAALPSEWQSTYFLNSLRAIQHELLP